MITISLQNIFVHFFTKIDKQNQCRWHTVAFRGFFFLLTYICDKFVIIFLKKNLFHKKIDFKLTRTPFSLFKRKKKMQIYWTKTKYSSIAMCLTWIKVILSFYANKKKEHSTSLFVFSQQMFLFLFTIKRQLILHSIRTNANFMRVCMYLRYFWQYSCRLRSR